MPVGCFVELDEFWLWNWFWVYFYDYFGQIVSIKVNHWPFTDSPITRLKFIATEFYRYIRGLIPKNLAYFKVLVTNSIFRYSIYCGSILLWSLEFFTWYSKILSKLRYHSGLEAFKWVSIWNGGNKWNVWELFSKF